MAKEVTQAKSVEGAMATAVVFEEARVPSAAAAARRKGRRIGSFC